MSFKSKSSPYMQAVNAQKAPTETATETAASHDNAHTAHENAATSHQQGSEKDQVISRIAAMTREPSTALDAPITGPHVPASLTLSAAFGTVEKVVSSDEEDDHENLISNSEPDTEENVNEANEAQDTLDPLARYDRDYILSDDDDENDV